MITSIDEIRLNLINVLLFIDNAFIHRAKTLDLLGKPIKFRFNVVYSLFSNPIEELFSLWEFYFRKDFNSDNNHLFKKINSALIRIKVQNIFSFFCHVLSHYGLCLDRQKIEGFKYLTLVYIVCSNSKEEILLSWDH